jgi:hypothetical protein
MSSSLPYPVEAWPAERMARKPPIVEQWIDDGKCPRVQPRWARWSSRVWAITPGSTVTMPGLLVDGPIRFSRLRSTVTAPATGRRSPADARAGPERHQWHAPAGRPAGERDHLAAVDGGGDNLRRGERVAGPALHQQPRPPVARVGRGRRRARDDVGHDGAELGQQRSIHTVPFVGAAAYFAGFAVLGAAVGGRVRAAGWRISVWAEIFGASGSGVALIVGGSPCGGRFSVSRGASSFPAQATAPRAGWRPPMRGSPCGRRSSGRRARASPRGCEDLRVEGDPLSDAQIGSQASTMPRRSWSIASSATARSRGPPTSRS